MKATFAVIASAALAVCAGSAAAESDSPPAPAEFADLDTNADMYIDKQEFELFTEKMRENFQRGGRFGGRGPGDRVAKLYDEADGDGDGLLNETEFAALQESVRAKREKMRQRWGGDKSE